jgi:hypothetical protein
MADNSHLQPSRYKDVQLYGAVLGPISMFDLMINGPEGQVTSKPIGSFQPTVGIVAALVSLKLSASVLIEYIEGLHNCTLNELCASASSSQLHPDEQCLFDLMMDQQFVLQRLIGQTPGPVSLFV